MGSIYIINSFPCPYYKLVNWNDNILCMILKCLLQNVTCNQIINITSKIFLIKSKSYPSFRWTVWSTVAPYLQQEVDRMFNFLLWETLFVNVGKTLCWIILLSRVAEIEIILKHSADVWRFIISELRIFSNWPNCLTLAGL